MQLSRSMSIMLRVMLPPLRHLRDAVLVVGPASVDRRISWSSGFMQMFFGAVVDATPARRPP